MQIVDAVTLADSLKAPFTYSKDAIVQVVFSNDSEYLATAEQDFTVSVYKKNYLNEDSSIATEIYTFLGRFRSHYKDIATLMFSKSLDGNGQSLFSLGKDRYLVSFLKTSLTTRLDRSSYC